MVMTGTQSKFENEMAARACSYSCSRVMLTTNVTCASTMCRYHDIITAFFLLK